MYGLPVLHPACACLPHPPHQGSLRGGSPAAGAGRCPCSRTPSPCCRFPRTNCLKPDMPLNSNILYAHTVHAHRQLEVLRKRAAAVRLRTA